MNGLLNSPMVEYGLQAFCWMLVHSLWQGLLLALVTGIVMQGSRRARAASRYTVTVVLFFLFLAGCGVTFLYAWNRALTAGPSPVNDTFTGLSLFGVDSLVQWPAMLARYCSEYAAYIVAAWFMIFCFRCWQMQRAWVYMRRIRTQSLHEAAGPWKATLEKLGLQLRIRKEVLLLESGLTRVPVVIGHLKPVIYMPLGLMANLPPEQVEAVLLHELAHIRRHDYVVNLVQYMAETVFFFNPGLLWVSAILKEEREHCCDDVALAHTGNKKQFIQALVSFKEHAVGRPQYVLAFPGRKSQLIQRVSRIIDNRHHSLSGMEKGFLLGSGLLCLLLTAAIIPVRQPVLPAKELVQAPVQSPVPAQQALPVKPAAVTLQPATRQPVKKTAGQPPRAASNPRPVETTVQQPPEPSSQEEKNRADQQRKQQMDEQLMEVRRMQEQAEQNRQKAVHELQYVERMRKEAEVQRAKAEQDRAQAAIIRQEAARQREQAEHYRELAEQARLQSDKERVKAEQHRQEAEKFREKIEYQRSLRIEKRETITSETSSVKMRNL